MTVKKTKEKQDQIRYQLHIMKALGWYINIKKTKQCDIANRMHVDSAVISRSVISPKNAEDINAENFEQKGKRLLGISKALEICKCMDVTLENILYFYQFKNVLVELPKIDILEELTNKLTNSLNEHDLAINVLENDIESVCKDLNISSFNPKKINNLVFDIRHSDFQPWFGQYFCYFSSTSSEEAGKKRIAQFDSLSDNLELNELLECATDEYIFCGIMEIHNELESTDGLCHVDFKFLANPEKNLIKKYSGLLILSANTKAVFCELTSAEQGEKTYFIFEKQDLGKEQPHVQCCMAMVLTYSSKVHRRRPCCERMIISSKEIKAGTEEYEAMKAYLRMNDSTIRITQWGYNELIKDINQSKDSELLEIAKSFPDLCSLNGQNVTIENCAFIPESVIYTLNSLTDSQKRKFEILLRTHSIAPWYCKTKATKADILFKLLNAPHDV